MIHSNTTDDPTVDLPHGFVWGVASSAFQIEGASRADGKGPSIWDEFCARPGAIADGSNGDVACDHYHRLESDLDLIADLGVRAYRFSIAWPRIQPPGSGAVNEPGLAFYERLVDGLLRRGIAPFATLYHWDLPAALQHKQGGWTSRDTVQRFADYAGLVAARLGDRIEYFATHNEPWVTAMLGHHSGIFAPGTTNRAAAMQVAHHCLLSHGLATQAIRAARDRARVGIVLNMSPMRPASDHPDDVAAAAFEDGMLVRWYMDALLRGTYPADVVARLGSDAPAVADGDLATIRQPLDFLGVNYYHPTVVSAAGGPAAASQGAEVTDMGWEVAPARLTDLLVRLDQDYECPPIFVTENGAAYRDEVADGGVHDEHRRAYLESHVRAVGAAVARGVDVRGYFVWSLLDNFEWAFGYSKRFGIVYVDYPTQRRILKLSGAWYRRLLANLAQRRPGAEALGRAANGAHGTG